LNAKPLTLNPPTAKNYFILLTKRLKVFMQPIKTPKLPIFDKRDAILDVLRRHQVVIVAGETGSGKTTQLPQFCLSAGYGRRGKIAITQPRRIAATSTAQRVADEMGCVPGTRVGYKIRFHEKLSDQTQIVFLTDGILLNEIVSDRLLKRYQTIIIDEAHERSLNIDFLLGYIRSILPRRPDLKVIVSSATIDTDLFSKAFHHAPVIEVSGRLYPVEVWYQALDQEKMEAGNCTYVDAAVDAIEQIVEAGDPGDVLVFMPTERDIREAVDLLAKKKISRCVLLPLFSRLTRYQQNRIFATFDQRKIVVATNIAETSITVPGVRYVVDTGLARMSNYAPRLRTNRLPVEPVSQASAQQRKGRCGRVRDGLCIRLYTEKDFHARPSYTVPEIKRSNLAGVILTMLSLRLGDIGRFPFLEPPDSKTIQDAFTQLYELGAVTKEKQLTKLGQKIAHLPLEPHIARMILQAELEGAQKEVAVIAAGLSIVDPRERPFDLQKEADFVHKQFVDPKSDFITLHNLWEQYHSGMDTLRTQGRMRRFCRDHFLSYNRMQEWHDVHQQILRVLKEYKHFRPNRERATPDAIHRSILSGLLCNVAMKNEKEGYSAARNRTVYIFPGSVLFKASPQWILCHEIVETSRVYARTVGPVDPDWLEEMAPDMCRHTYSEPFYDTETAAVYAYETVLFFGLPIIQNRRVAFRRIDQTRATQMFIREGLMKYLVRGNYPFLKNNRQVIDTVNNAEAKLRQKGLVADEEKIAEFYEKRLSGVSSAQELATVIRNRGNDRFLYMKEDDALVSSVPDLVNQFPDSLDIGGKKFALEYTYSPGKPDDGMSLKVPLKEVAYIHDETFGWLVPALWKEKVECLLRSLPKEKRKLFVPVPAHAEKIARHLTYKPVPFSAAVCDAIKALYTMRVDPSEFDELAVPQHLKMHIKIVSDNQKVVAEGRDFTALKEKLAITGEAKAKSHLHHLFKRFEKNNITQWDFGNMADQVEVAKAYKGFDVYGYPGLHAEKSGISLKLFPTKDEAFTIHRTGVEALLALTLEKEFAWLERELKFNSTLKLLCNPFGGELKLLPALFTMLKKHLLTMPIIPPTKAADFDKLRKQTLDALKGIGTKTTKVLTEALQVYNENDQLINTLSGKYKTPLYGKLKHELKTAQRNYIDQIEKTLVPYTKLLQYPRYFQAFKCRIEKAFTDPSAYYERLEKMQKYFIKAQEFMAKYAEIAPENQEKVLHYSMLCEEYAISLFAQQLKTIFPVSEKRLERVLEEIGERE